VLHVVIRLDYGGVETWLLAMLQHYDRKRFQMDVCMVGRRGDAGVLAEQARGAGSRCFVLPFRSPVASCGSSGLLALPYDT